MFPNTLSHMGRLVRWNLSQPFNWYIYDLSIILDLDIWFYTINKLSISQEIYTSLRFVVFGIRSIWVLFFRITSLSPVAPFTNMV